MRIASVQGRAVLVSPDGQFSLDITFARPAPTRAEGRPDMALHRMNSITIGVPNVAETTAYYTEFGSSIAVTEPIADIQVTVAIAPRIQQQGEATPYNFPGNTTRTNGRAPGILRENPVRPRKLGHVVIGSTDAPATQKFFTDGIGFKVSDEVPGMAAFMRCSTDHHNVLVQQAPINFLHHSSWQVDDVDDVGRGASAMLAADPGRHVWGLGRHYIGSNFFWYLKDPAGNFSEYYSDLDCIVDDALWKPGTIADMRALYAWGPAVPPSFLAPDDLAALMTGAHAPS